MQNVHIVHVYLFSINTYLHTKNLTRYKTGGTSGSRLSLATSGLLLAGVYAGPMMYPSSRNHKPHSLLLSWSVAKHSRGVGYAPVMPDQKKNPYGWVSSRGDGSRKEGFARRHRNPCVGVRSFPFHFTHHGDPIFLSGERIINARMGICQYPIINRVAAKIRMVPQNTHSSSVIVHSPLSCPV
jgi:hypothetical protein